MNYEKLSAWRFEVIFSWRTYQIIFYPNYLLDVFSSQNIMSLQSNNLVVSLWSLSNAGKSWWCYLALPGGSELHKASWTNISKWTINPMVLIPTSSWKSGLPKRFSSNNWYPSIVWEMRQRLVGCLIETFWLKWDIGLFVARTIS